MTDPKMLTAEQIAAIRQTERRHGSVSIDATRALLDHIAALTAQNARLWACVEAGERATAPTKYRDAMHCAVCSAAWSPYPHGDPEWHEDGCPIPAYHTARAALREMEGKI